MTTQQVILPGLGNTNFEITLDRDWIDTGLSQESCNNNQVANSGIGLYQQMQNSTYRNPYTRFDKNTLDQVFGELFYGRYEETSEDTPIHLPF